VHHNRALPVQVSGCYPVCCFLAHRVSSPLGATITGRGAVSPQNWCRFVTLRRYADPSPYTKQPATFTGRRVFLCPPTERKQHAHVSLRRRYALQPGGHRRTVLRHELRLKTLRRDRQSPQTTSSAAKIWPVGNSKGPDLLVRPDPPVATASLTRTAAGRIVDRVSPVNHSIGSKGALGINGG
jgi:hypothetical protein